MEDHVPSKAQLEIVPEIIEASRKGREIICLIGAGLSIDSGIPSLAKLTQYLAKVQSYITDAVFRPQTVGDSLPRFGDDYRLKPSLYLRDFGWPDPNQLNADLWRWIDQTFVAGRGDPRYRSYLDEIVRAELIEDLLRFDPELERGLGSVVREVREVRRKGTGRGSIAIGKWKEDLERGGLQHVGGNWRTLLAYLTDFNPDNADTLFQSLIQGRQPGMAQRFLAFLAPILGLRLFLTVNFDDLLEEALRFEGLHPVVYAVSRDSPLPHPSLVRSQLSVVKLHGDAFRLRLGEDLDQPLDEDSRKRLRDYLPDRPLLLVLGVGGGDRRVMDFVELVARKHRGGSFAAVYWFHFEPRCPESVRALQTQVPHKAIRPVRTYSPASFLLELFSRLTGSHPPSFRAYDPKMSRPIVVDSGSRLRLDPKGRKKKGPERSETSVWVFLDESDALDFGASLDLARFITSKAGTHIPIWLDLEAMHTYEDVAVEIIRQIRRYDRRVPPMTLPGGQAGDIRGVDKAVRRIADGLLRDRYVVAFNGVGSFGRPPTWHHGLLRSQSHFIPDHLKEEEEKRRELRNAFLLKLVQMARSPEGLLRDSILAFSLRQRASIEPSLWDELMLNEENHCVYRVSRAVERHRESDSVASAEFRRNHGDALMLLASFRRRRSYVALLQLLPGYLPEPPQGETRQEHVDKFLDRVQPYYILRLLGGEYWMCRRIRDEIYVKGREKTRAEALLQAFNLSGGPPDREPMYQLTLLARIHADIARYCYSDLFACSGDPSGLLEHVYHQVSSLRYLTKLDAWLLSFEGRVPEDVSDTVSALVSSETRGRETDGRGAQILLRELRLRRLRALRRVFARERETLLSLVSSDTLTDWVGWLQKDDLDRLRVATCFGPAAGEILRERITQQVDEECRKLERVIGKHCRELGDQLADLEADALRDKLDFVHCQEVRSCQIYKLFGVPAEAGSTGMATLGQIWERSIEIWLKSGEKKLGSIKASKGMRRLVRYLYDLWLCARGQNDSAESERMRGYIWSVIKEARRRYGARSDEAGADLEAMDMRWLRGAADHQLMAVSPWNLRGATNTEERKAVAERCGEAVCLCDEALRTFEWTAGEQYARYRSYFQSLKARALYLQACLADAYDEDRRREFFAEAHRELDRAQAGLPLRIGANREILAASVLRLAECLMVRANDAIEKLGRLYDDRPLAKSDDIWTQEVTSARRRLDRAGQVLGQAEEILIGARQNVEWWACLYQLRAQLQVERLLLRLAAPETPRERRIDPMLLPPQELQAGLNAIRQGLDVLIRTRYDDGSKRKNFRIDFFLRIWIELAVCGAILTRIAWRSTAVPAAERPTGEENTALWARWTSMNVTAGLDSLVGDDGQDLLLLFEKIDQQQSLPLEHGLAARRRALELVIKVVAGGGGERLWEMLETEER